MKIVIQYAYLNNDKMHQVVDTVIYNGKTFSEEQDHYTSDNIRTSKTTADSFCYLYVHITLLEKYKVKTEFLSRQHMASC